MALTLAIPGCSPGLVKVKGSIVRGGKPIEVGKGHDVSVGFLSLDDTTPYPRVYSAERGSGIGGYTVPGPKRKGIPPGKYKVIIAVVTNRGRDTLDGAFSSENSPI